MDGDIDGSSRNQEIKIFERLFAFSILRYTCPRCTVAST